MSLAVLWRDGGELFSSCAQSSSILHFCGGITGDSNKGKPTGFLNCRFYLFAIISIKTISVGLKNLGMGTVLEAPRLIMNLS